MSGAPLDPIYYLIVGPALLLMLFAQWRIKSTYARWDRESTSHGANGVTVAQHLLKENGMAQVSIDPVQGQLTDHYNPASDNLALSQGNYTGNSVAAMAVVAHEVGHAKQDFSNSLLMRLRSGIVPLVNIGSQLGPILFIAGLTSQVSWLVWIGLILFSMAFVFALVTLPVELDASNRAMKMLEESNLIRNEEERRGARTVLNAAALTYVAGMVTALSQLLYYISLALRGRRADRAPN